MGLSLEVGILTDLDENDPEGAEMFRQDFATLNEFLARCGLPAHSESSTGEVWSCAMYGYSGLHYLRRLAAHLDLRGSIPSPGDSEAAKDPVLAEYYNAFALVASGQLRQQRNTHRPLTFSHLINHSDAEGYYLPMDFPTVLVPSADSPIAGGSVGSSKWLLAECQRLAGALTLPANLDPEDEEVWMACENQGKGDVLWKRYGIESFTCLRLLEAATRSVQTGAAIVFC